MEDRTLTYELILLYWLTFIDTLYIIIIIIIITFIITIF